MTNETTPTPQTVDYNQLRELLSAAADDMNKLSQTYGQNGEYGYSNVAASLASTFAQTMTTTVIAQYGFTE